MEYKSGRRHKTLSWYLVCFFVVFCIFVLVSVSAFKVEADVAVFHSNTYTEQGVEVINESGAENQIQYDYLWTDFKGVVPPDAVVNSVVLRFNWSLVTRSVVSKGEEEKGTTTVTNPEVSDEPAFNEVPGLEEHVGDVVSEDVDLQSEPLQVEEPEREQEINVLDENNEAADILNPSEEEGSAASDTEGFEQISQQQLYIFANAQLENSLVSDIEVLPDTVVTDDAPGEEVVQEVVTENIVSEIVPEITPEVMIAESVSTTSGFVSEDMRIENIEERSFEVSYTTDGATWNVLGHVGFDGSHEVVYDLSTIGLEGLRNLQIVARYTLPEGDMTKIIFDSLRVEVGSEPLLIEEVIEPVGHDEREPNFEVSAIKSDVQSENIRAVVLERGSVFEFWYAVTDAVSGEVVWNKINGGGVVDENAPIAIKKRTIFWLDRNQQTLFGFAVDEGSLFATPFQDPENKSFLLPFTDDGGKQWEALFNSTENVLEFNRVKN
mgnify:CR=1 FL=1|jgi:hypothetical protein